DFHVTGVQTCALPISAALSPRKGSAPSASSPPRARHCDCEWRARPARCPSALRCSLLRTRARARPTVRCENSSDRSRTRARALLGRERRNGRTFSDRIIEGLRSLVGRNSFRPILVGLKSDLLPSRPTWTYEVLG